MDEAQMVGTGLGSVAVMAARLHSIHRWAVTGTPIGPGGLDDIQGLLRVLHHDPFSDPLKWKWCVANPYLTGTRLHGATLHAQDTFSGTGTVSSCPGIVASLGMIMT